MLPCTYTIDPLVPDVIPCIEATASWSLITSSIDPISPEMLNDLAVGEVTLVLAFLVLFVVFNLIRKYV